MFASIQTRNDDTSVSTAASRYKTTLCQSWKKTGSCSYETRCMFAHGKDDLRTKEQNAEDGLTTEMAIKFHQRKLAKAARLASKKDECPLPLPSGNSAMSLSDSSDASSWADSRRSSTGILTEMDFSASTTGFGLTPVDSTTPSGYQTCRASPMPASVMEPLEYPASFSVEPPARRYTLHLTPQQQAQGFHSHNPYAAWEYNPRCHCAMCSSARM